MGESGLGRFKDHDTKKQNLFFVFFNPEVISGKAESLLPVMEGGHALWSRAQGCPAGSFQESPLKVCFCASRCFVLQFI